MSEFDQRLDQIGGISRPGKPMSLDELNDKGTDRACD